MFWSHYNWTDNLSCTRNPFIIVNPISVASRTFWRTFCVGLRDNGKKDTRSVLDFGTSFVDKGTRIPKVSFSG